MSGLTATARVGALDEVNAQKLAYSEFGTRTQPVRPTLSAATDRSAAAIFRATQRGVQAVMDGKAGLDGEDILQRVGDDLAEEVRREIDNDVPPPLADSTLAARRRRGNASERTLVDTGEMMRSIKCEAVDGADPWPEEDT